MQKSHLLVEDLADSSQPLDNHYVKLDGPATKACDMLGKLNISRSRHVVHIVFIYFPYYCLSGKFFKTIYVILSFVQEII